MLLFNRRSFLLSAVALAGCGFTPAYGPNGTASALRGKIRVESLNTREGFTLAHDLEDIFAQASDEQYVLSFTIETDEDGLGINTDQEITRYHVTGAAKYTLVRTTDGQTVASGEARNFTAYSATGSTVSSVTATRDAYDRLMSILADQIAAQIYAKLATPA
ncbi:LPS assembly lipoprotein LptE [Pacificibacter sp. AS14]|uniref:LPS assembly lipoprotein LptE n=1 Tax=Pacificibacter sp. AS14 TaxID=3135785 RepID=UPI00317C234D